MSEISFIGEIVDTLTNFLIELPWGILATIFAGIVGSLSPVAVYRYYRRPKPVTGILPWDEMADGIQDLEALGMETPEDEINFNKNAFAHPVKDPDSIYTEQHLSENTRTFTARNEEIAIPIFVQNIGKTNMQNYKVTVTFNEENLPNELEYQTRILNVHTETLEVDGLFCDPEDYRGDQTEKLPNENLVQMYQDIGLPGHFVSFKGSLGSGTFESILLELEIQPAVDSLYVIIEIDCPDWFVGEKIFCQRVRVDRSEEESPPERKQASKPDPQFN